MARIVIVQPYVPAYRRALFDQLSEALRTDGHELVVASGRPRGGQAARRDDVRLQVARERRYVSRSLVLGPLEIRLAPSPRLWRDADVLIVELAAGSLPTYRALLGRRPVAVWGHVGSYVSRDRALLRRLRAWQVRRAGQVLAYTAAGAATAIAYGAPADRVKAMRNTVDTRSLRDELLATRQLTVQQVMTELGAPCGPLFAVIGGLDESKRVDLIADTLDRLWAEGSPIRFLVGGTGALEHLLHPARDRGQVVLLGYVDAAAKARMARVCTALFNPGRVGLIAVESFALGLPIVTTTQEGHAPEFQYLRPGVDSLVCQPDPDVLADTLIELSGDPDRTSRLAGAAEARRDEFPLGAMLLVIQDAIEDLLRLQKNDRPS